jgi:hypothetical protein
MKMMKNTAKPVLSASSSLARIKIPFAARRIVQTIGHLKMTTNRQRKKGKTVDGLQD